MKFKKGDIVKYVNPVDKWAKETGLQLGETYVVYDADITHIRVEGHPYIIKNGCFVRANDTLEKVVDEILKM